MGCGAEPAPFNRNAIGVREDGILLSGANLARPDGPAVKPQRHRRARV